MWERSQRVSSVTGARRRTRMELKDGCAGAVSWLENLQVKKHSDTYVCSSNRVSHLKLDPVDLPQDVGR